MKSITLQKRAADLTDKVRGFFNGVPEERVLTEAAYSRLAETLARHIGAEAYTVFRTGTCFIGKPQSRETVYQFVYYLLANQDAMRRGKVLSADGSMTVRERIEVRCVNVRYDDPDHVIVVCQAMTGVAANRRIRVRLTLSAAYFWLTKLGYSSNPEDPFSYPYPSVAFPGLYGALSIEQDEESRSRIPVWLIKTEEDLSIKTFNRKHILSLRNGTAACPFGRDDQVADNNFGYCVRECPNGWRTCSGSGHESAYMEGECVFCRRTGLLEVEAPEHRCVQCQLQEDGILENE